MEALTQACLRGIAYAHGVVTLPVRNADSFLEALREIGVPAVEAVGLRSIGALRSAMTNGSEAARAAGLTHSLQEFG